MSPRMSRWEIVKIKSVRLSMYSLSFFQSNLVYLGIRLCEE